MSYSNTLQAFQNQTEHHILMGMSETARVVSQSRKQRRRRRSNDTDTIVYLSPSTTKGNIVYAVPIPYLYTVPSYDSIKPSFAIITEIENIPLYIQTRPAVSQRFDLNDWTNFYLYPGNNGKVFTLLTNTSQDDMMLLLPEPFGGKIPIVSQISSASSSALSYLSGLTPSFFAHDKSRLLSNATATNETYIESRRWDQFLYNARNWFHGTSICSQWPNKCNATHGRFIDGGLAEGLGLAVNIGQYHNMHGIDGLKKTLKIIVTENNEYNEESIRFSSYYNTTYNKNIEPGDYIWAPGFKIGSNRRSPWRFMQIFNRTFVEEDGNDPNRITIQINGTNVTASLYDEITIANRAYSVLAGQKVQLLHLQTNSFIPTVELRTSILKDLIVPLGQLTADIITSKQLLTIIQNFINKPV